MRQVLAWLCVAFLLCASSSAETNHPIWFSNSLGVSRLDPADKKITLVASSLDVVDMSADGQDGVWMLTQRSLTHLMPGVATPLRFDLQALGQAGAQRVRTNAYDGSIWLTDGMRLTHLRASGVLVGSFWALSHVDEIELSPDESIWVLAGRQMLRYLPTGQLKGVFSVPAEINGPGLKFSIDAVRSKLWIWSSSQISAVDVSLEGATSSRSASLMNSAIVLNPRSGAVWAVSGHELLTYVDGHSATALDLAAIGLHDGRLVTYDAANDSLWLAHADGVSRIQLSTPIVVDETLKGMPAERIAASPFVVRPSIATLSSEPLGGNRLGPRVIKLGLDAFCYETSCGLPSEYFSRYRFAVTVDGKIATERFVIDGATLTATYLAAPGSAPMVAGHAVDPLGHSSNELGAAKAKAQAVAAHTAPTVTLTSPANNATFAAPASVALTATAAGNGATISKVDFYNGSALLKSVTASPYTYSWTGVAVGSYSLTAKATDSLGSSTTSSTVKIAVNTNTAPTISLTSPANGSTFIAPASVSLAAAAADSDGTISKVDFYNGTTLLKSVTSSPYTYTWSGVAAGTYTLSAKATDNLGAVTTSSTAKVVVSANVAPTVTLTSPTAGTIYSTQSSVPLSATAADSDGSIARVEFFSGTTLIGTSTSSPFAASWSGGTAGKYSITAKATDNLGATKTSAAVSVTLVDGTAPTVTLLQPQDGSKTTTGTQITLEASVDDPTVTSVAFYSGTKLLKTTNAAPWIYYYSNEPNGTYVFKAVATAGNGLKGTSPTSTVVVASPPPTINLTSPVAASRYSPGAVIVLTAQPQMVDTTVAGVQFYQGSTLLGTGVQNGTTYSYTWSNATSGYYSLVAKLTDSNGVVVSSAPVAIEMMTDACSARDTTSKSAQAMAKTASTAARAVSKTQIPLTFEANEGQADPEVRFQARGRDYGLQLSSSGLHLRAGRGYGNLVTKKRLASAIGANDDSATSAAIHMTFVGGNSRAAMAGEGAVGETSNYLVGRDSRKWLLGVPHFSKVRASAVYPGVDALYYGTAGELEYDLIVAAGADPRRIRLGFDGASKLTLEESGDLIVSSSTTEIRKHKPVAWQTVGGVRHEVAAAYVVDGLTVTFKLGQYDARYPLTIDPVISYATQFGSAAGQYAFDSISGIAVDAAGNAYLTGTTQAANFSLVDPLQGSIGAATSTAFITKLDPTGSRILYSTYFGGGTGSSEGIKIALDQSGNVYVSGETTSTDFPTTAGAFQATIGSTGNLADVFVAKLSPSGSALIYSTYVGGSATEEVTGLAVDSAGNAYVAGNTQSVNFPVTSAAIQPHLAASASTDFNGFALKLNSTGSALVYSTYLGGNGDDRIAGAALDAAGAFYLAGTARSANFPVTTGSFQTVRGGDSDAFVTKISVDGASLAYSTLVGGASSGSTNQTHGDDGATAIAVDGTGATYVLGTTNSIDFPVLNAYQPTNLQGSWWNNDNSTSGQYRAAFLTRLNPGGSAEIFSTYFGGQGCGGSACVAGAGDFDIATTDVSVDHVGNAYIVVGSPNKGSFPTISPAASGAVGPGGLYLAEFLPSGQPIYSTPLVGGLGSLAVDDGGSAYLAGFGTTAPTPDACEVDGPGKAYVMKVGAGAGQVTLTTSNNPAGVGVPLKLTATLQGMSNPYGLMSFYDGSVLLGSSQIAGGTATFSTSSLTLGSHDLIAAFGGDVNDDAVRSVVVKESVVQQTHPTIYTPQVCGYQASCNQATYSYAGINPFTVLWQISSPIAMTGNVALIVDGVAQAQSVAQQGQSVSSLTLRAGNHTVSVHFYGDSALLPADSPIVSFTILPSSDLPSVYISNLSAGQTFPLQSKVTLYAYAASQSGSQLSKVEFLANGVVIGIGTTTTPGNWSGTYRFDWPAATAGTYDITARVTDNYGATATSAPVSIVVSSSPAAPPVVSMVGPTTSSFLVPGTVPLAARGSAYDVSQLSKIEFYKNGTLLATTTPDASGNASFAWTVSTAGSYSITAKAYDIHGLATVSSAIPVVAISSTPPTVQLLSPTANTSFYRGQTAHLSASSIYQSGNPSRIDFSASGSVVASVSTPPYAFDWLVQGPDGPIQLQATAVGQLGVSATASEWISIAPDPNPPQIVLTAPGPNATVNRGQSVRISADASYGSGQIAGVAFAVNGRPVATVATPPYQVDWVASGTSGAVQITATVAGTFGAVATASQAITLAADASPPVVVFTSPAESSTYHRGDNVSLSATASYGSGVLASVDFSANGLKLASVTAPPYSFTWLAAGSTGPVTLTATAVGVLGATSSVSRNVSILEDTSPLSVAFNSPSPGLGVVRGQTLHLSATGSYSSGSIDHIDFYANGTVVGSSNQAPYAVDWVASGPDGDLVLKAVAFGSLGASASATETVTLAVESSPPAVSIGAPAPGASVARGQLVHVTANAAYASGQISNVNGLLPV